MISLEFVTFGIEGIATVRALNVERSEKLQIRVGANCGEPIVAGVLGIGKPMLEILGPAINVTQQMEHHGVSMLVRITEETCQWITGAPFVVNEHSAHVKGTQLKKFIITAAP
jgi:class 3 adenylate cyclase